MTSMPPRQVTPISIQAPDGCVLAGKVAIVTGANDSIGRQTALGLARQGATVVIVCRNAKRGQAAQAAMQAESGNPDIELSWPIYRRRPPSGTWPPATAKPTTACISW
jgi:NAD(P)-dependent dehydrogenase (short-subunit alcohol dehydrogenase family)